MNFAILVLLEHQINFSYIMKAVPILEIVQIIFFTNLFLFQRLTIPCSPSPLITFLPLVNDISFDSLYVRW